MREEYVKRGTMRRYSPRNRGRKKLPLAILILLLLICLAGTLGGIYGFRAGIFAADIMLLLFVVLGMKKVTGGINKLLVTAENRRRQALAEVAAEAPVQENDDADNDEENDLEGSE